tara:strand:- start:398 stop:592 length:195 start_codon:yes stop_codon:yes gene_type:complete
LSGFLEEALRMKRVTIEISTEDHKKLKLLAYLEGIPLGEVLKKAVKEFISSNKADLIDIVDKRE